MDDPDSTRYLWNLENMEAVQLAVAQTLTAAGLVVPASPEKCSPQNQGHRGSKTLKSGFGRELHNQPSTPHQYREDTFLLPK